MIPMAKPLLGDEEKRAVLDVLDSGMLAQGPKVAAFERAFAQFIGVTYAIATSNGTTALHTALLAAGIGKDDEVITTSFSFIATANAIRMCRAIPIFVDIDEKNFNIDPEKIEAAITSKTKAIMPVHLYGHPAEMDKIMKIAEKHHLIVIEDACQAHGAEYIENSPNYITLGENSNLANSSSQRHSTRGIVNNGRKVGSFGIGCFSFYPTKNITTGEGGMITCNDDQLATKIRMLINHGTEKKYYHSLIGFNYRMTDLAAAIGLAQFSKITEFTKKRRENAAYLNQYLSTIPGIIVPTLYPGHVFHQYTVRITPACRKNRDEVSAMLTKENIGNAIFYPLPIHKQAAYPEYHQIQLPVAEKIAKEAISLPVHPALTKQDLYTIIQVLQMVNND